MVFLINIVALAFRAYTLVLLARIGVDFYRMASPSWTPTGPLLVLANLVYALTDPPLRFLRKFIPPINLGAVALDTAFLVLIVGIGLLERLVMAALYAAAS